MTTGLLTLTQWLSPAFPVGGYAYSHGLETAISDGQVRTAEDLEAWLGDILCHGAGRMDATLLAHAMHPDQDLAELAAQAGALAGSRERWLETMEQGAAFTRTVNALTDSSRPDWPFPVAAGAAAAGLGLDPAQVISLYLHAFLSNLVSVGVRFVPLGQTEGQAVLGHLHGKVVEVALAATQTPLSAVGGSVFGADMAAIAHETQDVRLFKT